MQRTLYSIEMCCYLEIARRFRKTSARKVRTSIAYFANINIHCMKIDVFHTGSNTFKYVHASVVLIKPL